MIASISRLQSDFNLFTNGIFLLDYTITISTGWLFVGENNSGMAVVFFVGCFASLSQ